MDWAEQSITCHSKQVSLDRRGGQDNLKDLLTQISSIKPVHAIGLGEQSAPWDSLQDLSPDGFSCLGDVSALLTVFILKGIYFPVGNI